MAVARELDPAKFIDSLYGPGSEVNALHSDWHSEDYLNRLGRVLPALTLPLIHHLEQERPDIAVICERNARPIGRAMEALIKYSNNTRLSGLPFHYYKVSSRTDLDATKSHLRPLLTEIHDEGYDHVAVIDDWTTEGKTRNRFVQMCADNNIDARVSWLTFIRDGIDFSAWPNSTRLEMMPWREYSEIIGIDYTDDLERFTADNVVAAEFDAAIHEGARELGPILMRQSSMPPTGI